MTANAYFDLSIAIVTRNRCAELATAVESALAQQGLALEVRVYDNGSDDGTAEMIRTRFPEVVFQPLGSNYGACHARNLALRDASADYVFFLDDDAYFTDPGTAQVAVAHMRTHPTTAAVGLPFVEPSSRGMAVWRPPPSFDATGSCPVRSVVTCACVVQRETALSIGGFRDFFEQWGEERDFCIRLLEQGFSLEFIRAPALVHRGSAVRDVAAMQYLGIRNTLLFAVLNVPQPWMMVHWLGDATRLFVHKLGWRNSVRRLLWIARGLIESAHYLGRRQPVRNAVYARYRQLPGHGPIAVVDRLPGPLTRNKTHPSL